MLDKFAEELKQIRKSKDLTLQQVSVKTKIDFKFLEAMESGDFEFLPDLYVKAFVREYIKILNIDEQLYMKKYEAARTGKKYEESVEPDKIETPVKTPPVIPAPSITEPKSKLTSFDMIRNFKRRDEDSAASRRRNKNILYYLTAATIFFAGLFYLFMFSGDEGIIIPEKPWEEVIGETKEEYTNEEPVAAMTEPVSSDSLTLTIRTSDTSWMRIRLDDIETEEFILFPNSQKSMKASGNYKIFFGNARGVQLDLNGKQLAFNPKNTNVLRVQIDNSGVKELDQNTVIE
jgi:transcriptional regulator with XRE-family HTH domain